MGRPKLTEEERERRDRRAREDDEARAIERALPQTLVCHCGWTTRSSARMRLHRDVCVSGEPVEFRDPFQNLTPRSALRLIRRLCR